ncbi:MAG: hypothetical protein JSR77_15650 [Planctomycetes bacterium]|nr:hypothetical protein [Planctomycetota bacterium]
MSAGEGPSRVLKELSVTALLGTDRTGREGGTPATLLARAAVAGTRARAGRRCRAVVEAVVTCPEDSCAAATASQTATLERLLVSPDADLIQEWCTLARARGVRVPGVVVPVLLDWWARQPGRTHEVLEVTGTRGAWLAGLNPHWRKPVAVSTIPADADEVWQTGSAAERVALLVTVRKNDAARAVAMVRATWDADGAEERRKFVEVLGQGASAADEPLLESALDDRGKTVRREAARVLTGLAGSALRARMSERAKGLICVETTNAGSGRRAKRTIKIEPPKAFDKAWERDGIEEQAAAGKGKRAFWMVQVLSAADLSTWTALSGLAPSELLAALSEDEYFDDAFGAMCASIAGCPRQPDAALWSDAIISACVERGIASEERLSLIWGSQTAERSEALRLRFLGGEGAVKGEVVWRLLTSDQRAWSLEFSRRAIEILRDATPKSAGTWEFWAPIEWVSRLLHPGAADLFEGLVAEMYPGGPSESIRKSLDRVRLRAEMHREFQS